MPSGERPDADEVDPALASTDAAAFPLSPKRIPVHQRALEPGPKAAGDEAPASSYSIHKGSLLAGKYRVVRTIGSGGMGFVLAARHEQLDVPVAMKLLSPELVSRPNAVGRFLREARAASKLASSHVTRVLDVGTLPSGEPFMVMEYLAGEDLAYHAKRTRVSVADAIDYIAQAADAIAEAHAAGIVHRDLKPANLFLTKRHGGGALVKVLDFGVSKMVDVPGKDGDVSLTTTSAVLGSALYMSPEQMRSAKHVDHRTDVYALGACLYELLGGAPPFVAESFAELCAKAYTERPAPLSATNAAVSAELDAVLEKALAKEPDDRYPTIAALVCALAPFASEPTRGQIKALVAEYAPELELPPSQDERAPAGVGSQAPLADRPPAPRRYRSTSLLIALAVLAAVVGGAALLWPPSPPSTASASAPVSAPVPAPEPAPVPEPAPAPEPVSVRVPAPVPIPARAPAPQRRDPELRPAASQPHSKAPSRVNADLSEETCTAHLPDGTTRVVPCP